MSSGRSNAEIEQVWIDAWNDLYELVGPLCNVICLLPEFDPVSAEDCKAWLQTSAYEGFSLSVSEAYFEGRKAVSVS